MTRRFPLLDGTEQDLDERIVAHPDMDYDRNILFRQDYDREQLKWWETHQSPNGPAPVFNGITSSGGDTTVTISTGSTSDGTSTTTEITGPTINWNNWTEIRAFAWGIDADVSSDLTYGIYLSDSPTGDGISEGFRFYSEQGFSVARVYTGGSSLNQWSSNGLNTQNLETMGLRIFRNDVGNGHNVSWFFNGQYHGGWSESRGWPDATDLTLRQALTSQDGSNYSASIDGWLIELIS